VTHKLIIVCLLHMSNWMPDVIRWGRLTDQSTAARIRISDFPNTSRWHYDPSKICTLCI